MGSKSSDAATIGDLKEFVKAFGRANCEYLGIAVQSAGLTDQDLLNSQNLITLTRELQDRLGIEWFIG